MNIKKVFNLPRLFRLIKNDLKLHIKPILIVTAILAAFSFFYASIGTGPYFMILYIGGFIITSFAYTDLHDPRRAYLALTLPCSNLERFLNKWFLTSIAYAIGTLVIYYLFSLVRYGINLLIFQQKIQTLNIFQSELWIEIGKYIIFQSIILLGAITFKRNVLIKTILVLGCLIFAFELFFVLIILAFGHNYFLQSVYFISKGERLIFWAIIFLAAPFCWYATYLRLAEFELR